MKAVTVPIDRVSEQLFEDTPGWWAPEAYQGPGGLFAVRETDDDHTFQVFRLCQDKDAERVSLPFMTPEGARRFCERVAGGGDSAVRFG